MSFSAVTVVWQITDGRGKTDPGEGGLQVLLDPVLPERNVFSSSGMQFFVPTMENSMGLPSAIFVPLLEMVN